MNYTRATYWVVLILVALIGGGLLGWYYFLRNSERATTALNAARGLETNAPSFSGAKGSTDQNIALSLQPEQDTSGGGSASSTDRLWQVSSVPVAGAAFVGSSTLMYVTRSTGYVYAAKPASRGTERLTNTLRAKVYEALFARGGLVLERTLSDTGVVENFAGHIVNASSTSAAAPGTLVGSDVSDRVGAIAVNSATGMLLYTATQPDGSVLGMSSDFSGTKQKKLFSSTLSQLRLWWLSDGKIAVVQRAADDTTGYAFTIDKNGSLTPLAHGTGLTILPRASSTALLIGNSAQGALTLLAQVSDKSAPTKLPIATVADKCVWAPGSILTAYCAVPKTLQSSSFLNDWYRGVAHTDDAIWMVDALNGTAKQIYDPGARGPFDAGELAVDETGIYLSFINGYDGSLWVLRLTQ